MAVGTHNREGKMALLVRNSATSRSNGKPTGKNKYFYLEFGDLFPVRRVERIRSFLVYKIQD